MCLTKTAALLNVVNLTGRYNGALAALSQVFILERSAHFQASVRQHPGGKDRQTIPATRPTNHRRTRERRLSGTEGSGHSERDSLGYFQTLSPLVTDLFVFSNCTLFSADTFGHLIHFCFSCFFILLWWNLLCIRMRKGFCTACCSIKGQHMQTGGH